MARGFQFWGIPNIENSLECLWAIQPARYSKPSSLSSCVKESLFSFGELSKESENNNTKIALEKIN